MHGTINQYRLFFYLLLFSSAHKPGANKKMSPGTETCVTWLCVGLVTPHTVVTTERDPAC